MRESSTEARAMESHIQDLLGFVSHHAFWAGPVLFVACFGESLAVVSFFFPGTALLVATGALIPSGTVPLWPVLVCSILGAVAGDALSYWLGVRFGGGIARVWPFTRHPDLLPRGTAFFRRHGGKSVFIGRFFGPVRAIIPLAAGVMKMPARPFWVANVASALLWAPGVLIPGALVGFAAKTLGGHWLWAAMAGLVVLGAAGAWIAHRYIQRKHPER